MKKYMKIIKYYTYKSMIRFTSRYEFQKYIILRFLEQILCLTFKIMQVNWVFTSFILNLIILILLKCHNFKVFIKFLITN